MGKNSVKDCGELFVSGYNIPMCRQTRWYRNIVRSKLYKKSGISSQLIFFIGENKVLGTIGVFDIFKGILNEGVGVAAVTEVFHDFRDDEIVGCFTSVGTDESDRLTCNN